MKNLNKVFKVLLFIAICTAFNLIFGKLIFRDKIDMHHLGGSFAGAIGCAIAMIYLTNRQKKRAAMQSNR